VTPKCKTLESFFYDGRLKKPKVSTVPRGGLLLTFRTTYPQINLAKNNGFSGIYGKLWIKMGIGG